jgi:hypothetical protein
MASSTLTPWLNERRIPTFINVRLSAVSVTYFLRTCKAVFSGGWKRSRWQKKVYNTVISPIRYKKKEKRQKQKISSNKSTEIVRKTITIRTMQARKLNHRRGLRKQERKMKMIVFTCSTLLAIPEQMVVHVTVIRNTYNHLPKVRGSKHYKFQLTT